LKHIELKDTLVQEKFGLRPSTPTDKSFYKLTEAILNALNNRMMIGGLFCSLQQTFICMLIRNLYEITGKFLILIKSCLEGRYQKGILHSSADSCSDLGQIKHGVPQGSVLGMLLFFTIQ
jgi:hypothetical protein